MTIEATASCRVDPLDLANFVPTIRVTVDRAVPGDDTDDSSGLLAHATIELTTDECAALIDRLQDSLRMAMARRPWRVDRT